MCPANTYRAWNALTSLGKVDCREKRIKWNGVKWIGMESCKIGMEWSSVEWNGVKCGEEEVRRKKGGWHAAMHSQPSFESEFP